MAEINEEVLEQVSGGASSNDRFAINLTGPYWVSSYKEGKPQTAAIGWSGLTAVWAAPHGTAPYRVDRNGTAIGWTVRENFEVL